MPVPTDSHVKFCMCILHSEAVFFRNKLFGRKLQNSNRFLKVWKIVTIIFLFTMADVCGVAWECWLWKEGVAPVFGFMQTLAMIP